MLRQGELFPWGAQGVEGGGGPQLKGLSGAGRQRRAPLRRRGGGRPSGSLHRSPAPFPPLWRGPWRGSRVLLSLGLRGGRRRGWRRGKQQGPFGDAGMRAPRNTNQFLMGEKYRLMHLRSDSVGTEGSDSPGGSDCGETEACLDMEGYLGALENARGALVVPDPAGDPRRLPLEKEEEEEGNSLPYFPSEDDVLQSQSFMERDFQQFCSTLA